MTCIINEIPKAILRRYALVNQTKIGLEVKGR